MSAVRVLSGDAVTALAEVADGAVDVIVTDPPYGLSAPPDMSEVLRHWLAGDDYEHRGGGFMGQAWDAFVPGPAIWREAARVTKPGGVALVFAGARCVDLMAVSLRLAGWQVAGVIPWAYGQGMPKSLNVAKSVASRRGGALVAREAAAWMKATREAQGLTRAEMERRVTGKEPLGNIRNWEDGIAVIPAAMWPAIRSALGMSETPFDEAMSRGDEVVGEKPADYMWAKNGGRYEGTYVEREPVTDIARAWEGWGTALKPAWEPIIVAYLPGGLTRAREVMDRLPSLLYEAKASKSERVNVFVPDCRCDGDPHEPGRSESEVLSEGERACAACGKSWVRYSHPTVKPASLMRQLVVAAAEPGETVLDLFAGTGSTGVAAGAEGRDVVLVERDPVHVGICRIRTGQPVQVSLFD